MQKIRVERAALAKNDKELEDKLNDLEKDVKERLLAEGMDKASGKLATASLKRSLVGNVKDWEKVYAEWNHRSTVTTCQLRQSIR